MEYVYGALLLHKLGKEINEDNLNKILQASGANIEESKVKSLVISLKDVDIDQELKSALVATTVSTGASKEEKPAEEKEEKREAAAEGLSALFG
ncbi:MAG: 50S ribosomal protein L12 [Nanoarchaeota archaeon]